MKHIEKMSNLIGSIATHVYIKDDAFNYRPIHYYNPFFEDDPFTPVALAYPIILNVNEVSNIDNLSWAYWDEEMYEVYNEDGNLVESVAHNLGTLPFLFTHSDHQVDSHFVEGSTDIISSNEHTNIKMTELAIGARYQLWGQPWVSGVDPDTPIQRMGSDVVVPVPFEGRFGIESPPSNISEAINLVKFGVELCAQNNHLWITWAEQGGEVPSGISLMIKDLERHEDYKDDVEIWRKYEFQLYEVEKSIAKAHNINLPSDLGLDFNEPEYPKTVNDQILWDNHRLTHNLITEAELTLEYNKDLGDIKKAKKEWTKRKDINADLSQVNSQLRENEEPSPKVDNRINQ